MSRRNKYLKCYEASSVWYIRAAAEGSWLNQLPYEELKLFERATENHRLNERVKLRERAYGKKSARMEYEHIKNAFGFREFICSQLLENWEAWQTDETSTRASWREYENIERFFKNKIIDWVI